MALELLQLYAPTYGQTPDQGNGRTPRSLSKHKRVTFLNEIIQNSLTLARNDLRADFRQDSPPLFVTLLALDSFHQRLISRALSLPFASISCFPLFSPIFFTFHFLFHSRSIHRTLCRSFNTTFICGKKSRWTRLDADNSTLLEKKVPGFSSSTADCTLHFFFFFFLQNTDLISKVGRKYANILSDECYVIRKRSVGKASRVSTTLASSRDAS